MAGHRRCGSPPRDVYEFFVPDIYTPREFRGYAWPALCCLYGMLGLPLRSLEDYMRIYEWRPSMDVLVEAALAELQAIRRPDVFWRDYARDPANKATLVFASGLASIVAAACGLGEKAETMLSITLYSLTRTSKTVATAVREAACADWFTRLAEEILGPPPSNRVAREARLKCMELKKEK